jgi:PAS domain S-box-containing protein
MPMKPFNRFPANGIETDQRLVLTVLTISLMAATLFFVAGVSREYTLALMVALIGAILLAMHGKLKTAGLLGPLVGLVIFTTLMFKNYGIRDTALLGLPVTIVAASLINGQKGAIAFGIACLLIISGLGVAESAGLVQATYIIHNTLADYLVVGVVIVITTAIQWAVIGRLDERHRKLGSELTERLRVENALRESEARYRTMVETFPDIIMLTSLSRQILFVNAALEKQTGYTLANLQAWRDQGKDFIHPDDVGSVRAAIQDLLASDKPCTDLIENRFIDIFGKVRWYSGIISKVQYNGEQALQTVTREITERKQAEELTIQVNFELQRRLKELYALNAVAQIGASAQSEDEMLEVVVQTLYSSLYPDVVGVAFWDEQAGVLRTHPSAHRGMPASINQMTARPHEGVVGEVAATRRPYRMKDLGDPLYLALDPAIRSELCVPILAGDKLIGVLDVESKQPEAFSDADEHLLFTIAGQLASALERLRAEQQLRRLNAELEQRVNERTKQLEAANKELEAFSYSVSHDLRAPLRAIVGFSKILVEDFSHEFSAEARGFLEKIATSGSNMAQLIDVLLDFSQVGRKLLNLQKVELAALIQTVIDSFATETANRQIEWVLAEMPPVQADPVLLRQVYANLIGNAIKYTGKREQARIEIGSFAHKRETVYFVRDNGAGFDMQYAEKLFNVFQRLHRDDEFKGTGIGMAIVRRIIERHSGRIWAEAAVDQGATFYFTLGQIENRV